MQLQKFSMPQIVSTSASLHRYLSSRAHNLMIYIKILHIYFLLFYPLEKANFANVRYCECFAAGIHCDGCNCVNCHNNVDNEAARQEAVGIILERNPNAFRPKIASSPHEPRDSKVGNSTPSSS